MIENLINRMKKINLKKCLSMQTLFNLWVYVTSKVLIQAKIGEMEVFFFKIMIIKNDCNSIAAILLLDFTFYLF